MSIFFALEQVVPEPLRGQLSGGRSAIWDCRQEIAADKRYFVLAASGRGKTTMQHILYGIRRDYTGQVSVEREGGGRSDIRALGLEAWATLRQRQVAVVFQDLRLFPALTAMENIALKNELTGYKSAAQITEMAERLGVGALLGKKCGEMSYGQRQRFAIIRAVCQPFRLLLMDEPFSHLDKENIRLACQLVAEECKAQGAGYVLASLGERYDLEYDVDWVL